MLKLLRAAPRKDTKQIALQCSCGFSSGSPNPKESTQGPVVPQNPQKSLQKRVTRPSQITKDDLKWRTAWHEKKHIYYDTLRTFYKDDNNLKLMQFLHQPIDFSPKSIKNWWLRKVDEVDIASQQYLPERHNILGPELACAHFVVYRGGAVKFHNDDKWIKAREGYFSLPDKYHAGMHLQAIDCNGMQLRFEGLSNFRNLRNVEWLGLKGSKFMDDFCMDVISHIFSDTLLYLDLRDCMNITERGLGALYKMNALKVLYLDDLLKDTKYEMTCLLLEELHPELMIKSDVIDFEIKRDDR